MIVEKKLGWSDEFWRGTPVRAVEAPPAPPTMKLDTPPTEVA
jgi:hypothetical protein